MTKHNQDGSALTVVLLAILSVGLIAALTFGVWAFTGQQDYKNNVDAKVAVAVEAAKKTEAEKQVALAAEAAKSPITTYQGPETYGSVSISYPKTWSAYVDSTGKGNAPLDGYFAPKVVPAINDASSVFALHIQVTNQPYAYSVQQQTAAQAAGQVSIAPYSLPKVPSVVGIKVTGKLSTGKTGTLIIMPLRDKSLMISTEGTLYNADFETYVLPNASFSP